MFRRFSRNQLFGIRMQCVVVFLYLQHFLSPENNEGSIQWEPQDLIRRQELPLADGLGFPVLRRVVRHPPGIELLRFRTDTHRYVSGARTDKFSRYFVRAS